MLVGVLTLGVLTTATMVGAVVQPSPARSRPMIVVRAAMPATLSLKSGADLHVAREARVRQMDDFLALPEDPVIASKRRAFAETGRNCHVIGSQRCLSHPRTLFTLR